MPTSGYPFDHSGPVISALGSRGNFLTNSNDTEAEKRVNNVIVTKRRSHKAASQDWGRASRYALIELPRKPSAANDKGAPNMGIQRTRIPASRYPFGHSGPLIPGVRLPHSPFNTMYGHSKGNLIFAVTQQFRLNICNIGHRISVL